MSQHPTPGSLSKALCARVNAIRWEDIPDAVKHEAKRSMVNFFAVAFAGSADPTIEKALQGYARFSAGTSSLILGRTERTDMLNAAALNAMSANVYDFDDTHLSTIIHPTAPVAAALLAFASENKLTGQQFLHALILGMEVECRLGNAISPEHYARGFHITSTCGVIGSAVSISHVLGLSAEAMNDALGCAANQACGIVETLGTMSKSLSVGNAARNGLLSALLAQDGMIGPDDALAGPRGFLPVYGQSPRLDEVLGDFGQRWEMATNAYKPYPCGVVLNPVLEACLALSQEMAAEQVNLADLTSITLTGHPLLRQRTDRPNVLTGRSSQVSAQHAVPIALITGHAGLPEFSDQAVMREDVRALGRLVSFVEDETYSFDAATVTLRFKTGATRAKTILQAQGSAGQPMSDQALEAKLRDLRQYAEVRCDPERLLQATWTLETCQDIAALTRLACPESLGATQ